jgi:membrane associated rhomboid family serine protease
MIILPYRVKMREEEVPVANYILVGVTCAFSLLAWTLGPLSKNPFVLRGLHPLGLVGHVFLHVDWIHLVGNMLFLMVFGSAVCAKLGKGKYLLLYFASGGLAALAHAFIDGDPAVGASGAICGIMAAFLVLFPWNKVICKWAYMFWSALRVGEFEARGFWLIGLWVFLDLWWAALSEGIVAHWGHLGGYAGGFAVIALLIALEKVDFHTQDRPLLGGSQIPEEQDVIITGNAKVTHAHTAAIEDSTPPARNIPEGPLRLTEEERRSLRKPGRIVRHWIPDAPQA